jgi:hypothetical protein
MCKSDRIDYLPVKPNGWTMNPLEAIEVRPRRDVVDSSLCGHVRRCRFKRGGSIVEAKGIESLRTALTQGHNVCGIYMRNWNLSPEHEHLKQCSDEEDWDDVQEVCRHLNIPCAMVHPSVTLLILD